MPYYSQHALGKLKEALNRELSKETILTSLKKNLERDPEVVSKEIESKTVTLCLKGVVNGFFCHGKVILKKEEGSWKIFKRIWSDR